MDLSRSRVSYFSGRGKESFQCTDGIYVRDNGDIGIYSITGGVGNRIKSNIGGKRIQEAIGTWIMEENRTFFSMQELYIKKRIIEIIHGVLYNLSKGDQAVKAYESTLMMVVICKNTGQFRWIHIGNGIIAKQEKKGDIVPVSHPHYGIDRSFTFTTANKKLSKYLKTGTGKTKDISKFMLITDEVTGSYYKNRSFTEKGKRAFGKGTGAVLKDIIFNYPKSDFSMMEIGL